MKLNGKGKVIVSCVIPVYNEEFSIEPILTELLNNDNLSEVIVVDDCSSDKTAEKVGKFKRLSHKLKLVRNPQNMGKTFAVKKGIGLSKGNLICLIDGDVINLRNDYLNTAIAKVVKGECTMAILERGGDKISPFLLLNKLHFIDRKLRIKTIYCKELFARTHFKESSFVDASRHYIKVLREEFKGYGLKSIFSQLLFVEKDGLDRLYDLYYSTKCKFIVRLLIFCSDIVLTFYQFFASLVYAFRYNMFKKFY